MKPTLSIGIFASSHLLLILIDFILVYPLNP